MTHEVGHHLGLSHTHDGYDPALDTEISAQGPLFFIRAGDESATAMSYLQNTNEFSQFDRDSMARWQLAARLDSANRILGDIARSPKAAQAAAAVAAADAKAGEALTALNAWDLAHASLAARDAYRLILVAAEKASVKVEPWSGVADQKAGKGLIAAVTDPRDLALPKPAAQGSGLGLYRAP